MGSETTTGAGAPPWTIPEVNEWPQALFTERLGFLFEGSPWIAERAWHMRPFANRSDLESALVRVMREAPADAHLALIRAHPDLVGRAALAGTLTRESTAEQRAAGLDPGGLSPGEVDQFRRANDAYKARFGFPFVICARENKKESILAGFAARLGNERDEEVQTALGEIAKIAHYRLLDVIRDEAGSQGGKEAR